MTEDPKPKMDAREQRILIRVLAAKLRECRSELMVHRAFAEQLRERGYQDVDQLLEMFRTEPTLQEELDRALAWLQRLLPESERDLQEKELLEYLQKWQPEGEPN